MFFFGNCVGGGETFELFKILGKIKYFLGVQSVWVKALLISISG